MVDRIVEPIGFPLLLLGLFWLGERNNNPDRKADPKKMRFWLGVASLIACGEFATAWHNEIGWAWQRHPQLTFFASPIVFMTVFRLAVPIRPDSSWPPYTQNKVP